MRPRRTVRIAALPASLALLLAGCGADTDEEPADDVDEDVVEEDDLDETDDPDDTDDADAAEDAEAGDDGSADDPDAEVAEGELVGLGQNVFTDERHDHELAGEAEPGTAEVVTAAGAMTLEQGTCSAATGVSTQEDGEGSFQMQFSGETDEGEDVSLQITREVGVVDDIAGQGERAGMMMDPAGEGHEGEIAWSQEEGETPEFRSGDGELPIVKVGEDLEGTIAGTMEDDRGGALDGEFIAAVNCD